MHKLKIGAARRAIFAACHELGIDEETRHTIQMNEIGKASLSDMTLPELERLKDTLAGKGARFGKKGQPHNIDRKPMLEKIEALLADMNLPWAYADKIAENITGGKKPESIQRLAWVPPKALRGVIAQLEKQHKKRCAEARAALCDQLKERGISGAAQGTWCQEQIKTPGLHTAANPWMETIATLNRLTELARRYRA